MEVRKCESVGKGICAVPYFSISNQINLKAFSNRILIAIKLIYHSEPV